jgi:hypothetical protein
VRLLVAQKRTMLCPESLVLSNPSGIHAWTMPCNLLPSLCINKSYCSSITLRAYLLDNHSFCINFILVCIHYPIKILSVFVILIRTVVASVNGVYVSPSAGGLGDNQEINETRLTWKGMSSCPQKSAKRVSCSRILFMSVGNR